MNIKSVKTSEKFQDTDESEVKTKKSSKLKRLIIRIIIVLIILFVLQQISFFFSFFLNPGALRFGFNSLVQSVNQTKKNNKHTITPTRAVQYQQPSIEVLKMSNIPSEWGNISLDCENKNFVPPHLRGESYYCQNIYRTNLQTLLSDYQNAGKSRLILYGKNSYLDCPVNLGKTKELMIKCFNAALFLDSWQIPKMGQIMGVSNLSKKLYVYYTKSKQEVGSLCNLSTASACFDNINFALYLYSPRSINDFYNLAEIKASIYEGINKEIEYSFSMIEPSGCYMTHVHELIHFFNNQYFGYNSARNWWEEGISFFLTPIIIKEICPPGPTFKNVVRKEGSRQENVTQFDLASLNLEEPMEAAIESYANGSSCRKAIFKELARLNNEQKLSIPSFYYQITKMSRSYAMDYAKALYISEGSPEWLKKYFQQNNCSDKNNEPDD